MPCGMCGVVGLSDKALLRSMCEAIRHRGPDDSGYYLGNQVGLGVDRLSIIDVPKGDQPIHNEDESVWIVYNGEIYNYLKLRKELESKGHRFYTNSDTEVVVHAYEEWGERCVDRFSGMFAFAIWDDRRRKLYLARDRFGKKPLFYAKLGSVLLFGSEVKAIIQYDGLKRELNTDVLGLYFTYGYVPSPQTIFKGIWQLPPGSYATFQDGDFIVTRYWDFQIAPDDSLTEDAIIEELHARITEAVRKRLMSEVPLGGFLSGGIDSSTVVAVMARLSDSPVKTVSIGFNEGASELRYARMIAERYHTDHKEFVVEPASFQILPELVWHFDEPFADHSLIPTYYLSKVARRTVTVALSGDGGDEMFMGYPFMREPAIYGIYSKVPFKLRQAGLKTIMRLPVKSSTSRMAQHAYEKKYGGQSAEERYLMRVTMFDQEGLASLIANGVLSGPVSGSPYSYLLGLFKEQRGGGFMDSIDYVTVKGYLEQDILVKVDRMSMANSLEVRCPFLDKELVEFVQKIPSRFKLNGSEGKYIFKKMVVAKGLLPKEIAYRRKQGFGAPVHDWFQDDWREITTQLLDKIVSHNYTGLFDRDYVSRLLRDPYLNANRLFSLTTFLIWYQIHIEEGLTRKPTGAVDITV